MFLLTIALRVFTLIEFVVRQALQNAGSDSIVVVDCIDFSV
jgi:hypothetical protein